MDHPQVVLYVVVDEPNAVKQSTSSFAQEIWKNIMKEALPYLNIYPTEEIPDDMKDEVEAEQKAAEEAAAAEESSEESEGQPGRRHGGGSPDRRDSDYAGSGYC